MNARQLSTSDPYRQWISEFLRTFPLGIVCRQIQVAALAAAEDRNGKRNDQSK